MDDLQEIGALEQYVAASQCMLVFLSKGYFHSANCRRELTCATRQEKLALVLVHEADESKGGALLDTLRNDCTSQQCDTQAIFCGDREIITWHRVAAFQLLSLKRIAQASVPCP